MRNVELQTHDYPVDKAASKRSEDRRKKKQDDVAIANHHLIMNWKRVNVSRT